MCGIFALLNNRKRFAEQHIHEAFEVGKNRGPEHSFIAAYDEKLTLGFHRLAINGLGMNSTQPITIGSCTVICNGEIYNYKELFKNINVKPETESDCEIIIHLYLKYGIKYTVSLLDGVFAFVLYDNKNMEEHPLLHIVRDPFGVRPLWMMQRKSYDEDVENVFAISSDVKVLFHMLYAADSDDDISLFNGTNHYKQNTIKHSRQYQGNNINALDYHIFPVNPGTIQILSKTYKIRAQWHPITPYMSYYIPAYTRDTYQNSNSFTHEQQKTAWKDICYQLNESVKKRVLGTTERPIACLLSGGLDSSLITALVHKYYVGTLETFSIGMKGSEDLKKAKDVAEYLGTKHTTIELTKEEFFDAIPSVIYTIESYDTTTVRASVGNYLVGKYISEHSKAKVIFNGDGSDELTGGYLYFLNVPDDVEFDCECRRLLNDIHYYDVLRSDKCISSYGLETRTPFLDKQFVDNYLSLPITMRNPLSDFHKKSGKVTCEKLLLRQAFSDIEPNLLPEHILWRTKEAFSDGVSGDEGTWFTLIDKMITELKNKNNDLMSAQNKQYAHNPPKTKEQQYYRDIFQSYYPNMENIVPRFWMPKYVDADDSSATTLDIYKSISNDT